MSNMEFTIKEQQALSEFRAKISDILPKFDDYEAHNANLIRWLRARDLNVNKAEEQLRNCLKWRREFQADTKCDPANISEFLLCHFHIFAPCGIDKDGSPVGIIPIGRWNMKDLLEQGQDEEIRQYFLQIIECSVRYLKMISTPKKMHTQLVFIFDCDKLALSQVLSRRVLNLGIEVFQSYEAYYPERMKTTYVINVPKIFELAWTVVSPILSQRTLSKVKVLGGSSTQWRRALLADIDPHGLPSQYGGTNTAKPSYCKSLGYEFLPRAQNFPAEEFLTTVVPAREKFVISFNLSAGTRISWNFRTDKHDIGISFTCHGEQLFPYARADAHLILQDGLVDVVESGTYSLTFDNSYSKFHSKTLHYAIRVEEEFSS